MAITYGVSLAIASVETRIEEPDRRLDRIDKHIGGTD